MEHVIKRTVSVLYLDHRTGDNNGRLFVKDTYVIRSSVGSRSSRHLLQPVYVEERGGTNKIAELRSCVADASAAAAAASNNFTSVMWSFYLKLECTRDLAECAVVCVCVCVSVCLCVCACVCQSCSNTRASGSSTSYQPPLFHSPFQSTCVSRHRSPPFTGR